MNSDYIDKKRHTIKKEVYWQRPKSDTLVVFGSFGFSTFWLSFTQNSHFQLIVENSLNRANLHSALKCTI